MKRFNKLYAASHDCGFYSEDIMVHVRSSSFDAKSLLAKKFNLVNLIWNFTSLFLNTAY